ncbi:hypothetical protein BLOT_016817 [Blomia tropicalis]|nr:hypothetical protein BLOT_016817 [Blomia tropicalis]
MASVIVLVSPFTPLAPSLVPVFTCSLCAPHGCSRQASQRCFEHKLLYGDYIGDCSFGFELSKGTFQCRTSDQLRALPGSLDLIDNLKELMDKNGSVWNPSIRMMLKPNSGESSSLHFVYCIPQFGRKSFVNTKPNLNLAAPDRRITTENS